MSWSAEQYVKFESERTRPVRDLLARIPTTAITRAADLGCGPGNSTELLQACYPDAIITAIDNSADMIAAAKKRLPHILFEIDDINLWKGPDVFNVILANASLQWVSGHESLMPALISRLTEQGSLAVQMPDNADEPAHRLMRQVAADRRWQHKLKDAAAAREARHSVDWYYRLLQRCSAKVDIWRTTYHHLLADGAAGVAEWFKGTGLRPFLDALDENERAAFLDAYQAGIQAEYPALPDGTVLLPFPRLFFIAVR